ncbi:MAG: hypothetical protein ACUVTE_07140 [Candidatus Bathycorpusculaceae bacterium]
MRKKFSRIFFAILMVALLSIASYNLLFNGTYRKQSVKDSDSYAGTSLLDSDNDKIVDSLEKEIERNPSQTVHVII